MRIIIDPAKKMVEDVDTLRPQGLPAFVNDAERSHPCGGVWMTKEAASQTASGGPSTAPSGYAIAA